MRGDERFIPDLVQEEVKRPSPPKHTDQDTEPKFAKRKRNEDAVAKDQAGRCHGKRQRFVQTCHFLAVPRGTQNSAGVAKKRVCFENVQGLVLLERVPFVFNFGERFDHGLLRNFCGGFDVDDARAWEGLEDGFEQWMFGGLGLDSDICRIAFFGDGFAATFVHKRDGPAVACPQLQFLTQALGEIISF